MLRIKSVEFAGAIGSPDQTAPGTLAQVAVAGRSNVGKSSLINRLLGRTRKQIARVSSRPGKTQEINFYHVRAAADERDVEFFLVDLPGYGFARAPGAVREKWRPLIEGYLSNARDLKGVVQLLDARHAATEEDAQMVAYLSALGVPALFVLTKIDKLGRAERAAAIDRHLSGLRVDADQVLAVSAHTGEGTEELLESLGALLNGGGVG